MPSCLFLPNDWRGWEIGASTAAYLSISVDPVFVSELFSRATLTALPALSPDLGFEDSIIMNAARGIGAEIQDRNPLSGLLVESYVATIFTQLLRKQKYVSSIRRGGLTSANLNRVIETIDDELTADLSLLQLAELAGLSVPHFCRAFKQTLGCPPHSFIVRRRIDRAKRISSPLVHGAHGDCARLWFSSSSHFSNAFRREVGTTPLAYRGSWPNEAAD